MRRVIDRKERLILIQKCLWPVWDTATVAHCDFKWTNKRIGIFTLLTGSQYILTYRIWVAADYSFITSTAVKRDFNYFHMYEYILVNQQWPMQMNVFSAAAKQRANKTQCKQLNLYFLARYMRMNMFLSQISAENRTNKDHGVNSRAYQYYLQFNIIPYKNI